MEQSENLTQTTTDEIDLRRYAAFLGRWWRLIALCTVLGGLIAFGLGTLNPRVYEAEANLVVVRSGMLFNLDDNKVQAITDVGPGATTSLQDRRVSLLAIATSPEIGERVIEKLGSALAPELREPNTLQGHVRITGSGDLIQVQATVVDRKQAALIANAWAEAYRDLANNIYGDYSLNVEVLTPQVESTKSAFDAAQSALVAFIAQDPSGNLENEILARQRILTALQGSGQVSAQTVITKYQEAETRLLVNYLDAIVNTRSEVFSNQVSERIQELDDLYALKRKLQRVLLNAVALRQRLAAPGNPNVGGDQLAAMLLEASAFTSGADLPVTLQLPFTQAVDVSVQDRRESLDSLIQTLTTTEQQVADQIDVLAKQLIENKDYALLTEGAPDENSELHKAAVNQAGVLLRQEGLEALLKNNAFDPALTAEMQRLQGEIGALKAELETAAAKKLELESTRDIARVTYETLAKSLAETRVSEQSKGGVLRLATMAVVPRDPLSRGTMMTGLLGALIGLLVGILLAVIAELYSASAKASPTPRTGFVPGLVSWVSARLGPGTG